MKKVVLITGASAGIGKETAAKKMVTLFMEQHAVWTG